VTRYLVIDAQGGRRTGPFGAWWAWLTPADHGDVPASRARAWNVTAVLFAAVAVYGAARVGHLAAFLAVIAGMAAAAAVAIVAIERRIGGPFAPCRISPADVTPVVRLTAAGEPATARAAA
jgi:hypothetical protein